MRKMEINTTLLVLYIFIGGSVGHKILIVFPMDTKSHWMLGNSLARGLVQAGHDVTMISPFRDDNPPQAGGNYTEVFLTLGPQGKEGQNCLELLKIYPLFMIPFLDHVGHTLTENMFGQENFHKFIRSNQTFDLIIVEQFYNDALKVFSWYYKAPLIAFSTMVSNIMVNRLVGNPILPSYVPDIFTSYSANMNFFERLHNCVLTVFSEIYYYSHVLPSQDKLVKKYFPDSPDLHTYVNNVSLLLINAHESANSPVPEVPSMINIGGFHLRPPQDLPEDLKKIMDRAKEGVIYFSMGSRVNSVFISREIKSAIFGALGKLKQIAIIKWHEEVPNAPKNVITRKWCPQQEILAHPNVKLFITHGGLLSTLESIYHGVPTLNLPIFGDQRMNSKRAVTAGYGLNVDFSEITEESLSNGLNELLNNSKYTENVKQRSMLMKDRPVKPLDLAVYWCEFVIRHKGAAHLRVAALDLAWYQYFLLDTIAFSLAFSGLVVFVVYSFVIRKCGPRKFNLKLGKIKGQ